MAGSRLGIESFKYKYVFNTYMNIKFEKSVSKGSRFNQIYVPSSLNNIIEVGDLVEVRLLEKRRFHYSKNQPLINRFKEEMIREIFNFLNKRIKCSGIFIVGSFLTKIYGFNDIDLVILDSEYNNLKKLENELMNEFNQKFHVLIYKKDELEKVLSYDPMMVSMFSIYVADRVIKLEYGYKIDKKHILFLLMMPKDLLKIKLEPRIFYDSIRRLITIEHFLNKKTLLINEIDKEAENLLGKELYEITRANRCISDKEIKSIRKIIKGKIIGIEKLVKTKI